MLQRRELGVYAKIQGAFSFPAASAERAKMAWYSSLGEASVSSEGFP